MISFRLLLAQFRVFWRLRARAQDTSLAIRRAGFSLRSRVGDEADSSGAMLRIARLTLFDFSVALLCSGAVWLINPYLTALPSVQGDTYVSLLAGIAQVGGVFIGLYYAAITAAMTAVYAQMPNTVSQLLMQERYGNAYMRFVATLTFLAVNLLALHAYGVSTGAAGTPLVAIGSGIAIFGFVRLGTWAFRLFDPTSVSHAVFRDLYGLVDHVQVGGSRWQSPPFQQYLQRRCAIGLKALEELADACGSSRYLRDEPLVALAGAMLGFARHSVIRRATIPTKSFWYVRAYVQPDWYRTSDSTTSLAYHTGTLIYPQTVEDRWWVERRCEDIAIRALASLVDRKELKLARSLASGIEAYVETLAEGGWVTEALAITNRFEDAITAATIDAEEADEQSLIDRVALLDFTGRARITCILKAADWADQLGLERILKRLEGADWLDPTTPYMLGLCTYSLERAEWLAERLSVEQLIEGRIVSPRWYCAELLAQQDAEALARAASALSRDSFVRMWASVDRALNKGRRWEAACLLSDLLHYTRKLERHLDRMRNAMARVGAERKIPKLPWPVDECEHLQMEIGDQYAKVVERMSALITVLPKRPEKIPDYSGQFLHAASEQVFEYVLAGNAEALKKIFPTTFLGCLTKHDALRPADLKPDDPWAAIRSVCPDSRPGRTQRLQLLAFRGVS